MRRIIQRFLDFIAGHKRGRRIFYLLFLTCVLVFAAIMGGRILLNNPIARNLTRLKATKTSEPKKKENRGTGAETVSSKADSDNSVYFAQPIISHPDENDKNNNGIDDYLEDEVEGMTAKGLGNNPVRVLVTLWEPYKQGQLQAFEDLGGQIRHTYERVSYGFSGDIAANKIKTLAASLDVDLCIIEPVIFGQPNVNVANQIMKTDTVWNTYGFSGNSNMAVAVLDSGIDIAHDDLGDQDTDNVSGDADDWKDAANGWPADTKYKVVGWKDTTSDNYANPVDNTGIGHGTHISGIIAGSGEKNASYKGVANGCRLVGVKIATDNWAYGSDDYCEGLDWIITNKNTYRIKVACTALTFFTNYGYPYNNPTTTLKDKTNTVVSNGIILTASAGNYYDDGYTTQMGYPGLCGKVITVGGANDADQMAGYSSNGPSGSNKPDVAVPGGGWSNNNYANGSITSTDNNLDDAYSENAEGTGTSYSSPMVAGVAALAIQARESRCQKWQWTETEAQLIKSLILMTAVETNRNGEDPDGNGSIAANTPTLNRGGKDLVEGYGRINADAAVEAASMIFSSPGTAKATLGTNPQSIYLDVLPDKKVWAREVYLSGGTKYTFTLTNPTGADFDLYLYDDTPTANGDPVIVQKSTTAQTGGTETITITPTDDFNKYYLVVKWVSGSGEFSLTGTGQSILVDFFCSGNAGLLDFQGKAKIELPSGALSETQALGISAPPPANTPQPPTGKDLASPVYEFFPNGLAFEQPATITLRYNFGANPDSIHIYWYNEGASQWELVDPGAEVVDHANLTISVPVTHFSEFAVLAPAGEGGVLVTGYNSNVILLLAVLAVISGLLLRRSVAFS